MNYPRIIKYWFLCTILLLLVSFTTKAFCQLDESLVKKIHDGMKANFDLIKDAQGTVAFTEEFIVPENDVVKREGKYDCAFKGKQARTILDGTLYYENKGNQKIQHKFHSSDNITAVGHDGYVFIEKANPVLMPRMNPMTEGISFHALDLNDFLDLMNSISAKTNVKEETIQGKKYYIVERMIDADLMRFYIDPDKGYTIVKEESFDGDNKSPYIVKDVSMFAYNLPGSTSKVWFPQSLTTITYDSAGLKITKKLSYEYSNIKFNQNLTTKDVDILWEAGSRIEDTHLGTSSTHFKLGGPMSTQEIMAVSSSVTTNMGNWTTINVPEPAKQPKTKAGINLKLYLIILASIMVLLIVIWVIKKK